MGRMSSRPQFSLRVLLFAAVMVCLAAATVPAPREGGGLPQDQLLARRTHAVVRLALCVVFPAMLVGGSVVRTGYARTFWLGGILPALVPFLLASSDAFEVAYYSDEGIGPADVVQSFEMASYALVWALAPSIGLAGVLFHWLLKPAYPRSTFPNRTFATASLVLALVATSFVAAMLKLPRAEKQPAAVAQLPIRLALCLTVPACLSVGAVQGRSYFRTFCMGGAIPALVPALLVCSIGIWDPHHPNNWETSRVFELRYFIVAMWALVPCFALASVVFHWLFQTREAKV